MLKGDEGRRNLTATSIRAPFTKEDESTATLDSNDLFQRCEKAYLIIGCRVEPAIHTGCLAQPGHLPGSEYDSSRPQEGQRKVVTGIFVRPRSFRPVQRLHSGAPSIHAAGYVIPCP